MSKHEPYDCTVCKAKGVTDILVEAGIAPADRAICGDCKVAWGKKLNERALKTLARILAKMKEEDEAKRSGE